jgi:mediator of replication checkpoint protein 1
MQSRMNALSDDSSDGDDEILRPRGRMAARMLAQTTKRQQESSEEDEAPTTTRAASPKQTSNDTENNHNDSDDEVRPARPRKLVPRRQRSPTPNTAPPAAASSPGLFISPQKDDGPGSPGLFVSPSKLPSHSGHQSDDDDDNEMPSIKNPRFKALVERKRQERLAREAEEARKQAERRKAMEESMMDVDNSDNDDEDHITDDEGGHRLTQEAAATTARAPRKASKKALEEMNRETQRLARSLQLAHEAKVRKKITKATLFERFNFRPDGASDNKPAPVADPAPSSSRPPTPGSGRQSDVEMKDDDTPPSSPPSADEDGKAEKAAASTEPAVETTAENAATSKLDKGKGKATDAEVDNQAKPSLPSQKRKLRVKLPSIPVHTATTATLNLDDDDDDDLQVVPTRKSKIDAIFDRVPANQAKESHAFQRLRRLANLDDPDRLPAPPTRAASSKLGSVQHHDVVMTPAELQATLLQRQGDPRADGRGEGEGDAGGGGYRCARQEGGGGDHGEGEGGCEGGEEEEEEVG